MKLLKKQLQFLENHAHLIDGIWVCRDTEVPIAFKPQSSFIEKQGGVMYNGVAVITFIHCPQCDSQHTPPPVDRVYLLSDLVDRNDYTQPSATDGAHAAYTGLS